MSPYHRPLAATWWLRNRAYFLFMVRELTSVFIAAYAVLLLLLSQNLRLGREAYDAYLGLLRAPAMLAFHLVALAAALYHAITWINITPKILVARRGEQRIPPAAIAGVNYAVWIVISAVVAWLVTRA